MKRSPAILLIVVALVIYGVYTASFIPPLLVGRPEPLLLAGFVLQACAAILAAVGVWTGSSWGAGAMVMLGAAIAATELAEAFVLGVIAYDRALIIALLAVLVTVIGAAFVRNPRNVAI
jgi:hypothetical protein